MSGRSGRNNGGGSGGFGLSTVENRRIRGVLGRFGEIERAVIYGSRAKGCHRKGSDIDLCLRGEGLDFKGLYRIWDELDALDLPYTFDVCLYSHLDDPEFIGHIERAGKVFFRRESGG